MNTFRELGLRLPCSSAAPVSKGMMVRRPSWSVNHSGASANASRPASTPTTRNGQFPIITCVPSGSSPAAKRLSATPHPMTATWSRFSLLRGDRKLAALHRRRIAVNPGPGNECRVTLHVGLKIFRSITYREPLAQVWHDPPYVRDTLRDGLGVFYRQRDSGLAFAPIGSNLDEVRAQAADLLQGIAKHAFRDAQHGHHGPHAKENAENAQHRAHFSGSQQVGPQRRQPRAERL